MSQEIFPVLNGLSWTRKKVAMWSTQVQTSFSGIEKRNGAWSYPRWKFSLTFDWLEDDGTINGDLQQIVGLFNRMQGKFEDWLYEDPEDNAVTKQAIGIGDGNLKEFQLVRAFGNFVEPVRGVKNGASIYVDDVLYQDPYTISDTGLLTFTNAPTGAITATFGYYFRVRFNEDVAEFEQFMYKLWQLKKCEFISLKGAE